MYLTVRRKKSSVTWTVPIFRRENTECSDRYVVATEDTEWEGKFVNSQEKVFFL